MNLPLGAIKSATLIHSPSNYSFLSFKLLLPITSNSHQLPLHYKNKLKSSPFCNFVSDCKIGKKWMEYQGINNWDGLLNPIDDKLRREILRYGQFVEAAYRSFDFDPSSPSYATCKFPKDSLFSRSGFSGNGYKMTKNLRATSGVHLPGWVDRAPGWVSTRTSWIGYVAVCQDKDEIARLGRRDVVIAYRGTATCLEWLENLRATLTCFPDSDDGIGGCCNSGPMVESGFLSLYTSSTATCPSLQNMVKCEIERVIEMYGDEALSFTVTGHSLGAALATLTSYDIKSNFSNVPMVTVMSFGGPRVGNKSFRCQLDNCGIRILRIVNSDDLITKVPGFVIDNNDMATTQDIHLGGLPSWLHKHVENTQWVYAEVGRELRLSSKESLSLDKSDVATCHDLSTYLHLVRDL